ncbi:MAG TPA: Kdo hydroxylase family protein [Casimicrobiaceae bacterium]|jgi:hypothetical protein
MPDIVALDIASWRPALAANAQELAIRTLEGGGVLTLPRLGFTLAPDEERFLSPRWSDGRAKNISLYGGTLKGARGSDEELAALSRMVARFATEASALVTALFPRYASYVRRARTSFRPQPATGRELSWRKDDSRLHIDAFPSRPTRGERILRVFCNVSPGEDRVWRVGENFEMVARRFLPHIRRQIPGEARWLSALHVTKGLRSPYDHLMLGLHDKAKADLDYQSSCEQQVVHFAPGTTWLCFSDQLMHAAVAGQYMLEQTVDLPLAALYDRERSPLAILERLCGRALAVET